MSTNAGGASASNDGLGAWQPIATAPREGLFLGLDEFGAEVWDARQYWLSMDDGAPVNLPKAEARALRWWAPLPQAPNDELCAVVEALRDFVNATSDIKRWAQGHFDGMPDFKCSGPWPQPILIEKECNKLRAAYRKHADTLARISAPNTSSTAL